MEVCCGTTCDKSLLYAELNVEGAKEFVKYLEAHVTEDCSTEAIDKLLSAYAITKLGVEHA